MKNKQINKKENKFKPIIKECRNCGLKFKITKKEEEDFIYCCNRCAIMRDGF